MWWSATWLACSHMFQPRRVVEQQSDNPSLQEGWSIDWGRKQCVSLLPRPRSPPRQKDNGKIRFRWSGQSLERSLLTRPAKHWCCYCIKGFYTCKASTVDSKAVLCSRWSDIDNCSGTEAPRPARCQLYRCKQERLDAREIYTFHLFTTGCYAIVRHKAFKDALRLFSASPQSSNQPPWLWRSLQVWGLGGWFISRRKVTITRKTTDEMTWESHILQLPL